jgi:hypothetical protein
VEIYEIASVRGASTLRQVTLPAEQASNGRSTQLGRATETLIQQVPERDWGSLHPAPHRQLVVVLEGRLEVRCPDGTAATFDPGQALLAADTDAEGHFTRNTAATLLVVRLPSSSSTLG